MKWILPRQHSRVGPNMCVIKENESSFPICANESELMFLHAPIANVRFRYLNVISLLWIFSFNDVNVTIPFLFFAPFRPSHAYFHVLFVTLPLPALLIFSPNQTLRGRASTFKIINDFRQTYRIFIALCAAFKREERNSDLSVRSISNTNELENKMMCDRGTNQRKRKSFYAVLKIRWSFLFSACIRMNRECVHTVQRWDCVWVCLPRRVCANVSLE